MDEEEVNRRISLELNCICGAVLAHTEYIHNGHIVILVNPCDCTRSPDAKPEI
jgi:hypothetical protein